LDEPVAGLNSDETAQIARHIRQQRSAGHTMLLVEHDMELVMDVADQVVVLDSGRCIACGRPERSEATPWSWRPTWAAWRPRPEMIDTHLLAIEGLIAHYGAAQALFGIDLTIDPGETVALVGANGAGKTTLLKCIMGLMKPSAGNVLLDGEAVTGQSPVQMVRKGLALTPEGREVFPHLTVAENLELGAAALKTGRRESRPAHAGGLSIASPAWMSAGTRQPAPCPAASSRCWPWGVR
jgi:ABC-type branched-subunit amino acid transport system ATPase component